MNLKSPIVLITSLILLFGCNETIEKGDEATERNANNDNEQPEISVSKDHPGYWQYKGETIMLLGGTVEDNLFQIGDLDNHLDLLQSVGGNYVRNTMSSRDSGNVWPFHQQEDGLFDLNRWNEEYWNRFNNFLDACEARDIIVQLEVWATFDFYRDNWLVNPFNPKNNVNYNERRSKLPLEVNSHPIFTENPFFRSVPNVNAVMRLLEFQQKYVDKLLSVSMKYPNVLYCMDNETSVTAEWGKFWANYIQKVGKENGRNLQTTEMWDPWDLDHLAHRETIDHPEYYSFVDISQNNHNTGDEHWSNGIKQIDRLKIINAVRPLNNVKVYGNDGGRHHSTRNGIECFIRNVLFGAASTRFHRPPSGQGLNENAQKVIQSMRILVDTTDFFSGKHHNNLLSNREENEAYCRATPGKEYIVYFTDGGNVTLSLESTANLSVQWLDVMQNTLRNGDIQQANNELELIAPGNGHWIAIVKNDL